MVDEAFLTEMDVLVPQPPLRHYLLQGRMPPRTVFIEALYFESGKSYFNYTVWEFSTVSIQLAEVGIQY